MANLGLSLSFGIHLFSVADVTLCSWLKYMTLSGLLCRD
ncbi:hypothetical protein LINPERPRIM_LOCUS4221 [Linum perenne]